MNPDDIELRDLSKQLIYFKSAKAIDSVDDIETLRDISKSYIKLYLKQQEVLGNMGENGQGIPEWSE